MRETAGCYVQTAGCILSLLGESYDLGLYTSICSVRTARYIRRGAWLPEVYMGVLSLILTRCKDVRLFRTRQYRMVVRFDAISLMATYTALFRLAHTNSLVSVQRRVQHFIIPHSLPPSF